MKIIENKKINESSLKTLSEVRQAAWDLANGMGIVDDFISDTKNFIKYVEIYFNGIRDNNIKKASFAEEVVTDMIVSLRKNYKL